MNRLNGQLLRNGAMTPATTQDLLLRTPVIDKLRVAEGSLEGEWTCPEGHNWKGRIRLLVSNKPEAGAADFKEVDLPIVLPSPDGTVASGSFFLDLGRIPYRYLVLECVPDLELPGEGLLNVWYFFQPEGV